MLGFDCHATYAGRPLEVLQGLIAKRVKYLHEVRRDAVVATMITALKSIRAATRKHKGKGVKING